MGDDPDPLHVARMAAVLAHEQGADEEGAVEAARAKELAAQCLARASLVPYIASGLADLRAC